MRKRGKEVRLSDWAWAIAGALMLLQIGLLPVAAQTGGATDSAIAADSAPYRLTWDGRTGALTRRALGNAPERRAPLAYLHTDAGPRGFAKYLGWFLARDKNGFALLWCYLNDNGRDFWCWQYQYPANLLTTQQFRGRYRFAPPATPADNAPVALELPASTPYRGPQFTYRDWTTASGALPSLVLRPAVEAVMSKEKRAAQVAFTAPPKIETNGNANWDMPAEGKQGAALRVLADLRVTPLHEIQVGAGNGWRTGGWRELHALARDGQGGVYYLILYSNSTRGFVVDLQRARTYTADFGAVVRFPAN